MSIPKHPLTCSKKTLEFAVFLFFLPTVCGSNCSDTSFEYYDDCDNESPHWFLNFIPCLAGGLFFLCLIYSIVKHRCSQYKHKKWLSQRRANQQAHVLEVPSSTNLFSISDLSSDSPSHAQFGGIYYKPDFPNTTHAKFGGIEYGRPVSTPTHATYGGFQYGQHPSTPTHAQYGGFTYSPNPSASDTIQSKKFWKRVFKD